MTRSKAEIFQKASLAVVYLTVVFAFLHLALLVSDSPDYRRWVLIQIGLTLAFACALFFASRFKSVALVVLVPISLALAYTNHQFVNYGDTIGTGFVFLVFWIWYAYMIRTVWSEFRK